MEAGPLKERAHPSVRKRGPTRCDTRFRSQFRKTEMCTFFLRGWCSKGDKCEFAHGPDELQPMPDLSKTSLCRKWLDWSCKLSSDECPFAHGSSELRVTNAYANKPSRQSHQAEQRVLEPLHLPAPTNASQLPAPFGYMPRFRTSISLSLATVLNTDGETARALPPGLPFAPYRQVREPSPTGWPGAAAPTRAAPTTGPPPTTLALTGGGARGGLGRTGAHLPVPSSPPEPESEPKPTSPPCHGAAAGKEEAGVVEAADQLSDASEETEPPSVAKLEALLRQAVSEYQTKEAHHTHQATV